MTPPMENQFVKRRRVPYPKQHSPPWKQLMVHRHHMRSQPNPFVKFNNLKGVSVQIGNKVDRIALKKRTGNKTHWANDVYSESSKYRMSFWRLTVAQHVKIIDSVAKVVFAICVDRPQLKADGYTYFVDKEELAIDTLTVVDCLQNLIFFIEDQLQAYPW